MYPDTSINILLQIMADLNIGIIIGCILALVMVVMRKKT